jgi:hypothetical protein
MTGVADTHHFETFDGATDGTEVSDKPCHRFRPISSVNDFSHMHFAVPLASLLAYRLVQKEP